MKILQAFDFLSLPHGGGTVDIVYKLSKALSARGHDITICTGDHEIDYKYLSGLGDVGLKMYHSYFNKHGVYLMPGLLGLDVRDYDLIHFHCYRSIQDVVLMRKAISHNIPYIVDAHGSTVPRTGIKTLLLDTYDRLAGRRLINHARFVVAETEVGVAEWEKLGASRDKIRLQHPLLDTDEFARLPEQGSFRLASNIDKDDFIVLFLGRIHHAKGIDTLVRAVHRLQSLNSQVNVKLVIAGNDDGYKDTVSVLATELGISDRVLFVGYVSGEHKLAALVDADVLVQPSRNEAGARPSLESIMCGVPVIVSRDTGVGQVISRFDGGLLFQSDNDKELAERIQDIIDNPASAMGRTVAARRYIEDNLSFRNSVSRYEELYRETANRRN